MATNEADALVAAWCAALPYPAEDLVGTATDAWAVPQTSQTALGSSVSASLSALSADAAKAALPRWHNASLAEAATTYRLLPYTQNATGAASALGAVCCVMYVSTDCVGTLCAGTGTRVALWLHAGWAGVLAACSRQLCQTKALARCDSTCLFI